MSRTRTGRDWMSDRLFGNAPHPTQAQIIALSESSATIPTPNTWTNFGNSAGNELSADGFARKVANYAHAVGTQIATLDTSFTHTGPSGGGTPRTIRKVAVYAQNNGGTIPGAADSGIPVFFMDQPNPPTLTGTDALAQTVTLDFGA